MIPWRFLLLILELKVLRIYFSVIMKAVLNINRISKVNANVSAHFLTIGYPLKTIDSDSRRR